MRTISEIRDDALKLVEELHELIGKRDDVSITVKTVTTRTCGERGYYESTSTAKECKICIGT